MPLVEGADPRQLPALPGLLQSGRWRGPTSATALRLCRLTGTEPSLLLHPLDFLGGDDVPALAFFPAMNLPGAKKVALVGEFLDTMARSFELVPMGRHADAVASRKRLPVRRAT